nr:EOG090X0BWU [Lepidurus arcticus]
MVLKNVYMDPLKKVQVEGYVMFAEPELLFGNLDELCCVTYAFCKEFMTLLMQSMNIAMPTAEILVKLFQKSAKAHSLSQAYHRYALNYINALNYLETLRRHVEFCEFEKWCNRDPRCKKLQLTDLLVAPVQHIMKVPLLLKEIESRTENLEDREAVNHILEREEASLRLKYYETQKPAEIPKTLEDFLFHVAKTGDTVFPWSKIKYLLRQKLDTVMISFHASCPTEDLPPCPNVDPFNYQTMRDKLLEQFDYFNNAPFSIQRLCELLTTPKRHYKRTDKFMRGLEKNLLVVSTSEPGQARRVDENSTPILNGNEGSHDNAEVGSSNQTQVSADVNEAGALPIASEAEAMLGHAMTVYPDPVGPNRPSYRASVSDADSGISESEEEDRNEVSITKPKTNPDRGVPSETKEEQPTAEAGALPATSEPIVDTRKDEARSMDVEKEPSSSVTDPETSVPSPEVATTVSSSESDSPKADGGLESSADVEDGAGIEKLQLVSDSEADNGVDSCLGSKRPLELEEEGEGGEAAREFKVARTKSPDKQAQELVPAEELPKDLPDEVSTTSSVQSQEAEPQESLADDAGQLSSDVTSVSDASEPAAAASSVMEET